MNLGKAALAAAGSFVAAAYLMIGLAGAATSGPTVNIRGVEVPGVLVTEVSPNVAGSPNCLVSGSTCMRDANNLNTSGNPIVEGSNINGPAENLLLIDGGTQYQFAGHTTLCLGLSADDTHAVTQPCNGGHGIVQTRVNRNGAIAIINDAATQHFGTEEDISGVNLNGAQIGPAPAGAQGAFQRWSK